MGSACSVLVTFDWPEHLHPVTNRKWTDFGDIWSDAVLRYDHREQSIVTIEDVHKDIKKQIAMRMDRDSGLTEMLVTLQEGIIYSLHFNIAHYGEVDAGSKHVRLRQLQDVFVGSPHGKQVQAHVKMRMRKVGNAENWQHKYSDLIRHNVEQERYQYLRVGNGIYDGRATDLKRTAVCDALIARIDTHQRTVQLTLAEYWDFGPQEIGDGMNGRAVPWKKDYLWKQPFKGATSIREFEQFVLQQAPSISPDISKWPRMSFNTFVPGVLYPLPGQPVDINIVVRWVNRIQIAGSSSLTFQNDTQFTSKADDSFNSTIQCLSDQLRNDVPALFRFPFRKQWGLELWVVSQGELLAVSKNSTDLRLYRYPRTRGSNGSLQDFMAKKRVDAGMKQLYMEAHIVPHQMHEDETVGAKTHTE
ncbi:hypothetical protein LTR37_007871 [Vermiconidia calcicola]|uniref:Uncharacterized protein n=1 Tax=Vermiconidia calcicola TaxID=1690605 RepID=A0ACC3NF21_9PEZI|nr:hypothetical protein LTR37_007871 [Vermiconidia calcicola]